MPYLVESPHSQAIADWQKLCNKLEAEGWELITVDNGIGYFRWTKDYPPPAEEEPTDDNPREDI